MLWCEGWESFVLQALAFKVVDDVAVVDRLRAYGLGFRDGSGVTWRASP